MTAAIGTAGKSVAGVFKRDPDKSKKPATEPVDPIALNNKAKLPGADFYVTLAQLKERSGDLVAAQEQYNKALEVEKNNLPALLGLARLYDNQGQMQKATEAYQDAAKKHPREASPHNDLALCYARQGRFAEASVQLNRAVELQPDRALYHNNLATVLVELDRPQEALQQLSFGQGPAVAHYNLGFLLARRGKNEAAAQQFASALEQDPNFLAARQSLERLGTRPSEENNAQVAMQPSPRTLPANDPSAPMNIQFGPPPQANPSQAPVSNRGSIIASDPGDAPPPVNDIARDTMPVQQSPASQVRPVRDLAPLAPLRSETKAPAMVTEPDAGPAIPPTPDRWKDFSTSNSANANQARLQPLPPVDNGYYPPSRY